MSKVSKSEMLNTIEQVERNKGYDQSTVYARMYGFLSALISEESLEYFYQIALKKLDG